MKKQKLLGPLATRSVCLIALLGCSSLSWAQAPAPAYLALSEQDFLADMPIVMSVSRLPQRLDETPGAVTLIDRDMIRLSGARDVADLLRLVPGFQSSTSFQNGAPVASYHGGFERYSARIQVLVDGRLVYTPYLFGGTGPGLQSVALADIERIEVLRGSNSAAYGARAMLGVINIVTRHSLDTLGLQAGLAAGENGIRDAQARIGWSQNDASFRLTLDRRADEGLSGANGHNQVSRVNFRVDLSASAQDEIQLRAGGFGIDYGTGLAGRLNFGDPLRDASLGSSYLQLDWRRSLGEDEDIAVSASHGKEAYVNNFEHALYPGLIVDFGGRVRSDTVSLQHTLRHSATVRVVLGGELRREQVTSKPLYNTNDALVTDFRRLFANAEWRLAPSLVLNAGGLYEKSNVSGDSFAPRLMLNWHIDAGQTLRAGISRAYRPPSTFEKYGDVRYTLRGRLIAVTTQASGTVQPEKMLARELGYLGEFANVGLSLDARVFHEQTRGFVKIIKKNSVNDFVNGPDFSIQGIEYQLNWRPWRDAKLSFSQAYIDIDAADMETVQAAPKRASTLTFFQKLPGGLDLSLMHQDSTATKLLGARDVFPKTRTDLRLALPLRFGVNRGELALVVQNLGSPYQDYAREFRFERRAFVTLRMEN